MGRASYNTAYTAHFVRPNFGFAETSYMLETLCEIATWQVLCGGLANYYDTKGSNRKTLFGIY